MVCFTKGKRREFQETEIEAHSSVKFTKTCGSFFGIVGFSDKNIEVDVESKYVDDGSLKCIRTRSPWKQLLHAYHFFAHTLYWTIKRFKRAPHHLRQEVIGRS